MKFLKACMVPFKGFLIGSSMTVPGVSGGTMAILLGIYDRLIASISHFTTNMGQNIWFLLKFCFGSVLGFAALASTIGDLLEKFPIPVSFFFFGAIIGGVPALYRKTKESRFKFSSAVYILVGMAMVLGIGFLPKGLIPDVGEITVTSLLVWLLAGLVIALALVLPGISTSHMLLVLGIYGPMTGAIKTVLLWLKSLLGGAAPEDNVGQSVLFLVLLVVSTLVGVFLITRPLEWAMNKFPHQTYCMIMGFVIGSLADITKDIVWPALFVPHGAVTWIITVAVSLVMLAAGFTGIWFLSRFSDDN